MTRLLIIEHEDNCGPGWVGEWWRAAGAELDVVRGYAEPLPTSLEGYAALVVLGGSMNATADAEAPWLPATRELIRQAVTDDAVPFLGLCLGHQLAAVALGGEVGKKEQLTLGLTPFGLTDAGCGDALLGAVEPGRHVVQYNEDHVLRPPSGAVVLASAPDEHIQALRFGPRAWGLQFHPEVSPAGFDAWTVNKAPDDPDRIALRDYELDALSAEIHAAEQELIDTWRPMALRFLSVAEGDGFHGKEQA